MAKHTTFDDVDVDSLLKEAKRTARAQKSKEREALQEAQSDSDEPEAVSLRQSRRLAKDEARQQHQNLTSKKRKRAGTDPTEAAALAKSDKPAGYLDDSVFEAASKAVATATQDEKRKASKKQKKRSEAPVLSQGASVQLKDRTLTHLPSVDERPATRAHASLKNKRFYKDALLKRRRLVFPNAANAVREPRTSVLSMAQAVEGKERRPKADPKNAWKTAMQKTRSSALKTSSRRQQISFRHFASV